MSELDPPLKEAPDFLAYGDWETSNDSGNAITNRQNYAEYVRGEYAKTNSYSPRIEDQIRQATYDAAIKDGVITPDADEVTINTLFAAPSKVTFDDKLRLIQNNLPQGDPAYTAARDYLIHKDLSRFGTAPEGAAEEYLQNAESVADEGYQRALKIAVNNNEILMAKIRDADGAERIISAPNLPELTPLQAIEAGRLGGLTFADIDAVSSELSTPIGLSEPLSRVKRYSGAAGAIEEIAKKDKSVAAAISRAADTLAEADKDGEPMAVREYDAGIIRFRLNNSGLLSEGDTFTEEEVAKAITQIALSTANANGRFKLYDDPEDMDKNVRVAGYMSPLVHPAVMINDDLFEQSVTNNNKLSDTQKTIITESREAHLQASFEDYNKTLTQSSLSDEWLDALQAGRASGEKDTDILREFTSNPENFSELKDRALGVGASIADGFGELVAAIPMMMGADWARDYMVGNIKERNNRREVARMFKTEYGMGQDIMETIAPMLVDMTATALLAAPTAGTAGATYLMAKQGARLTAKGLVKAAVGSTFRQLPNETAEAAAERVLAQNLIRASTTEAGRTGAMKAISAYNNVVARRIGVSTAVALPAFNRSAGATYAAVYSTLQEKGELSPEEMHDRALGAGLTAGIITAAITSAFGVIGRGGLEEALLGGATRKQLKQVVTRLAGVDDISDDVFNRIVAQQLSESLKRLGSGAFGKEVLKNAFDEGVEEGLDEFINGFVVDAATDEDTPFLERLEQAARAAIIGGVIGGGVPVIRAAKDRIVSGSGAEQARAAEIQFARGVSEKLAASGSPITAQTVYTILTAPRRARAPIAEAVLAQSRQRAAAAPEATKQTVDVLVEVLNNNTSPEAVAKILVDERGQGLFPFMEDIVPNEVVKRKRKARKPAGRKSPVIEQLEFDFESKRTNKLQGELVQGELDLGLDTSSETKPKVRRKRTTAITQTDKKTQLAEQLELDFTSVSTSARNNHVNPSDSDDELTPPTPKPKRPRAKKVKPTDTTEVADEPMFDLDEFIDDELIGQEVTAMTKLASLGYPVRLQRKALFGMPQRGKYPKDYLVGKSDLLARKVRELFPPWGSSTAVKETIITGKDKVSYYDSKSGKTVRGRPFAFVDPDGVGIFDNDPVFMKVLLDRHIPVLVPADFTGQLNPAFRTFTSGGLTFINDIVTVNPESGSGFVSALTKQDRVLSSEPNYQYYNSLASFITLFNTGIAERSVPNPKGGEAEVTLDEIISNSDRLVSAASSGRGTITFGDSDKATATLRSLLKPFQGTLEQDFFEAAVPAFSMAVRKEAYLFELRLAMEKFAQTKDGETTPSLKPKSIQPAIAEFMARTKLEGPEAKVSVARSLANVFGSDIDPAKQPDLVIQDFLENHVLTRRKTMPTLREIGSKVGNAFADQQRSRNLIERKALFETTSPDDLAKIQDDAELFDPETEAEDDTFIPPTGDYPAPTTEMVSRVLEQAAFDVADALDSDPELRGAIDELLRGTVFSGNSSIDVTKFNSTDAFGMLASWMSSGNYKTNPAALQFQRDLRDGVYENAEPLRRTLKLMYLSSKTTDGNPAADAAFLESVRENLAASFGRTVTQREASDFIKSIGGAIQKLWSRSYVRGEQIIFARQENDAEVERLGLRTNDPQSVIDALKKIAATEPDANKKLLAKLLLENQAFIREVEFSLDESSLQYAGSYIRAANGQPMVSINLNGHNGRGLADVLLHEYLHAFVSVTVASPNENLTAAQRGALQRVNGILELARQSAAANGVTDPVLTDGLENVNEFIAHFFTSTEFQGYLKALVPPAKQRGFFGRLIDALLDMFGLNRSRQQSYQEAFTDIVDLTREAILRAPLTPKGLANQIARPASGILNQAAGTAATIRRILASSVGAEGAVETETEAEPAIEAAAEAAAAQVTDTMVGGEAIAETTAQMTEKLKDVVRMVRRMVPMEFALEFTNDLPYAAAFVGGTIQVNPARMASVIAGLDSTSANGVVEAIITEESAHAASFNALTQVELDSFIGAMKPADFDSVADAYYQTPEAREAAKQRLRSEDEAVVRAERENLAEEKLRMHSQKVTRGFTTEEDVAFWRSKPSLLKILSRYLKGFMNRYAAGRSVLNMRGAQRVVLQRMIIEVRAINAGYRVMPNRLAFDVNNPVEALARIASQFGASEGQPTTVLNKASERYLSASESRMAGFQSALEEAEILSDESPDEFPPRSEQEVFDEWKKQNEEREQSVKLSAIGRIKSSLKKGDPILKDDLKSAKIKTPRGYVETSATELSPTVALTPIDIFKAVSSREDVALLNDALKKIQETARDYPEALRLRIAINRDGDVVVKEKTDDNGEPVLDKNGNAIREVKFAQESYRLRKSPKLSKNDATAIRQAADLLEIETVAALNLPSAANGIGWYAKMRRFLQRKFGASIEITGQLLGATSARTPVDENFKQTLEALRMFSSGEYDQLLSDYDDFVKQAKQDAASGKLFADWKTKNPTKRDSEFTLSNELRTRINSFDNYPLRPNGKKFSANSKKVLQALYGNWIEQTKGPKTPNFAGNLTGRTLKATIDVWAARTLRRVLYSGKGGVVKWRILPSAETGVTDIDFFFGQEVMQEVANRVGMAADDLQALLWFFEKDIWDTNNWTKATGKKKSSFEEEASKLNMERFQAGVSTFTSEEGYSPTEQEIQRQNIRTTLAEMDGVVVSRVTHTEGLYGDYVEPSLDVEFSIENDSEGNPKSITSFVERLIQIAANPKTRQMDVFVSQVVEEDHPNARPMLEIGFKEPASAEDIANVTKFLRDNGVDGFTIAKDDRGGIIGIRTQYIPEISKRFDDSTDHTSLKDFIANADNWLQNARAAESSIQDIPNVSYFETGFVSTTVYGTEEYGKVTPIDNGRTSLEMELGRRAALNLGLESSIENLDAILRGTTSVTATRRRALATGLVAVSGDGPQSGDGGVIQQRVDVSRFSNKVEDGPQSMNEVRSFISKNFDKLADYLGVEMIPNIIGYSARYVVSSPQGGNFIEFNPREFIGRSPSHIYAVFREELIHAASNKALKARNQTWVQFYSDLAGKLTDGERAAIKKVYRSARNDVDYGAEYFRMGVQKLLDGTVTEAEARSNAFKRILELISNVVDFFRNSPRTEGIFQQIFEDTVQMLQNAEMAARPKPRKAQVRATQFGAGSQLPAGFDADAIDYSAFIESLDMPVMEMGTYQSPTKMLDKLFRGELDPRIQKLKDQRDFFNKATFDLVRRYKTKMDAIIKRDFGSIEEAPVELIQAATGSTKGIVVPEDVMLQIEDDFDAAMETIDIDDTLSADDRVAAVELAFDNRAAAVAAAEKAVATEIRNRRDDALNELAKDSPELVAHIVQLRTLTDELSKKVTELYGFPPELKAKFDNQLGIYLTRTYRMFDEIGYADAVLNDPNYEDIRTAAIHFFENQFLKQEAQRRMTGSNPLPRAQAEAEAQMELERKSLDGRTYGQLMMEEFVRSYDKSGSDITSSGLSQSLKPMLNNIKMKRDLPKPIRDLLGEKGDEVGADNLLRSLITVGTMAANQSFLNHVRTVGHDSGWLLSAKEIAERRKTDYGTYGNYKPIRETASSAFDPLRNLYGPPELVDALHKTFSPDGMSFNQTTAQIAVEKTVGLAAKLSGAAMAAKTLGSIGFYIRNVASNALFFAPAQGFLNFKSMAGSAYSEIWSNAIVDPARVDSYRTKLISLGVIGDDINTNIMEAMLRGGVKTVDDIESKVDELINTAQKGAKPLAWLANRAQILSASVDAFYKISYYENELRVLRDARDVDTGRLANASDAELERMAAQKVLATAQSASQAPPLIREFTKSGVGLLFAPFIRFKAEVPRIVLNTYRTALTEMKSGNPVLYRRGIQRFSGMTIMLGGVSAILPAIASYLAGIGEDEDEALRAGLPEYLRNHTFFYFRRDNGQLQSWDFTFLNPFSLLADPVLRSMEHLLRGEPAEAAAKLVQTALFDQYLDDQILSAAIQNLRDNVNPTTARPIYEPQLDSAGTILFKSMFYVFKDAYLPSVMKRAIDSYRAVGADYTEFDDSPMGILMREFYPVKRHDIELDKSLRRYLFELRETYNRVGQRKNALLSQRAMEPEDVKELIQSEIEDKARINEDLYHKLRGFEGLGLTPQQLYQITTGAGVGKSRTRLLFNQLMDRPTLSPEMIQKLSDPENPQGAERLKAAAEVLRATPRYILLEP